MGDRSGKGEGVRRGRGGDGSGKGEEVGKMRDGREIGGKQYVCFGMGCFTRG